MGVMVDNGRFSRPYYLFLDEIFSSVDKEIWAKHLLLSEIRI